MSHRSNQLDQFTVAGCSVPNTVQAGETVEFDATVNNPTNETHRVGVRFDIGDGVVTTAADVPPGTQTVTATPDFGSVFLDIIGGAGTYSVAVQLTRPGDRDNTLTSPTACGSLTVEGSTDEPAGGAEPEGEWDAEVSLSATTIAPGDTLEIDVTVTNVGGAPATDEFLIAWDGDRSLCDQFNIGSTIDQPCLFSASEDPGGSVTQTVTMGPDATGDVFQGDHNINVIQNPTAGGSTVATGQVTVSAPEGFNPDDVTVTCPNSVTIAPGDTVAFEADVINDGDQAAEVTVDFKVGDTSQSDTVTVAPGSEGTASVDTVADDTWLEFAGLQGGGTADLRIETDIEPA